VQAAACRDRVAGRTSSRCVLPAAQVTWIRGFFSAWNDETAEEYVRDGIKSAVDAGRYGDLSDLYICLVLVLIRRSRVRDAHAALDEADRSGAWTTSSFQEDMARVLVKEYAGDLDGARELAQGAIARSRISGSTYWLSGFLAQLGFVETSARDWRAALEALREIAEIFAGTKMVDLEQLLWGVDYADAALQIGAEHEVEAAISVLRRQGASGRPEAAVAADRCQALLSAGRGDVDEALGVLRKVVEQPGSECPFEAARSRLALGQVYRRAGYKGMASQACRQAGRRSRL
jgi:tetratricopeptide (TPR) repeat protein